MSQEPEPIFDPDEFLGKQWQVFDGDAGGGYNQGIVTFVKNPDNTYDLEVDGEVKDPTFFYNDRTRTLDLPDGSRSISYWDGDSSNGTKDRIFGARRRVPRENLFSFEKGGNGSWGAEDG